MTSQQTANELPSFLAHPDKKDRLLYGALMLIAVYGFVVIPFRAVLLLKFTFLYTFLTGSNLSVLVLAAENAHRPVFLAFVVIVAALSAIKFYPLFYMMGAKWGPEFISMSFAGHPPLWFRKLEGFIRRHLGFCMFLSFVPFSPIPATILVAMAGIEKVKSWVIIGYSFIFAAMLKCFYLYLGLRFGPTIQDSLETIDKYVTRITFALIAWMFISIWWKNRRNQDPSAQPGTSEAEQKS